MVGGVSRIALYECTILTYLLTLPCKSLVSAACRNGVRPVVVFIYLLYNRTLSTTQTHKRKSRSEYRKIQKI